MVCNKRVCGTAPCSVRKTNGIFGESPVSKTLPFWSTSRPKKYGVGQRKLCCVLLAYCLFSSGIYRNRAYSCVSVPKKMNLTSMCVVGWILAKGTTNHESAGKRIMSVHLSVPKHDFKNCFQRKRLQVFCRLHLNTHKCMIYFFFDRYHKWCYTKP